MEKQTIYFNALVFGLLLAIGLIGAGFFVAQGVYKAKSADRFVTVKGIAEREVKADLGIWQIDYREVGSNLVELNKNLETHKGQVIAFLKAAGFTDAELEVQPVKVNDRLADVYNNSTQDAAAQQRYIITSGVRIRTARVDLIQKVNTTTGALLQQGVPLSFPLNFDAATAINPNPSYYFTKLDTIRAEMLLAANRSAKTIAEQFAKDSQSKLGAIRRANQGIFQIMGRDFSTQSNDWNSNQNALGSINKTVRLVTTVDYFLTR